MGKFGRGITIRIAKELKDVWETFLTYSIGPGVRRECMNFKYFDKVMPYENFTLRPNFQGLTPPYLAAFVGPVNVTKEGLCDLDDVNGDEPFIRGYMLNFIGEFTDCSMEAAVWRQYFFASVVLDRLLNFLVENDAKLDQKGDDIFLIRSPHFAVRTSSKLTVSIVAPSVNDTILFHFGINLKKVENYSAAYLFNQYFKKFDLSVFAKSVFVNFKEGLDIVAHATQKVRKVGEDGYFINKSI